MKKSNKNISRNRTFSPESDKQDSLKKKAFYANKEKQHKKQLVDYINQ